jgi:hypothetical protein
MIYTALCVMHLMRAASITWASGRGWALQNLEFRALESRAQVLDATCIKIITHGAV